MSEYRGLRDGRVVLFGVSVVVDAEGWALCVSSTGVSLLRRSSFRFAGVRV